MAPSKIIVYLLEAGCICVYTYRYVYTRSYDVPKKMYLHETRTGLSSERFLKLLTPALQRLWRRNEVGYL